MNYWMASDLNAQEMGDVARLLRGEGVYPRRVPRGTESFQAGRNVFGTSRQQGLRPTLFLQVCRTPPTFAHNRLRYQSPISTKGRRINSPTTMNDWRRYHQIPPDQGERGSVAGLHRAVS